MAYYHSKYQNFRKKPRLHRLVIYLLILLIAIALTVGYFIYELISKPNVWVKEGQDFSIYIPTGSNFENVKNILYENGLIIHRKNFEWWARKKKYPENIKPGKYLITNGMSNNELVNHLRSGNQQPVNLIFNNIRDLNQLSKRISEQIELDSATIIHTLKDTAYIASLGFDSLTITTLFIPNTYEIFWNVGIKTFMDRMQREYENFWNSDRRSKAESLNMSISDVVILASILDKETQKNDEKPIIAGVYINRLKRSWLLQADPTLIFAIGDFNIKRVLNVHKEIDSPYNTYKYKGLPPGPICIPSISSIDAVLNYSQHNYLYFCAKDDLSGYHVFARSFEQHNINAENYRRALDKLRIWK